MVYSRSLFLIYFKSNSMNMSIPILKFCLLQITNFLLVPISLFSKSLNLFPFSKLCHLYPFLDLTYKWMMWYLTLCLTYFTLYDLLWVHQCCCNGTFHSFLGWGICHCIYVQFLYPYICLRISYMPQRLGCCIQCCSEKKRVLQWTSAACVCSNMIFCRFLPRNEVVWLLYFVFFEKPPMCYPYWLVICIFLKCKGDSLFSRFSLGFIVCSLFDAGHWDWCEIIPGGSGGFHFSNRARMSSFFVSFLCKQSG